MSWSFRFRKRSEMPEGLWMRCDGCTKLVFKQAVLERHNVCPECDHHFRLGAAERIALLADKDSFVEFDAGIEGSDPLAFRAVKSYADKLAKARKATGMRDAVVAGECTMGGHGVVLVVIDANFIQGSMGAAVGEKLARAAERALARMWPLIFVSGSGGGARMEEGAISLMQMAKTSAALARLHEAGGCYFAVLTHATMGGSMASWAMLGDVIIGEPKALLGFTGPRVIQNTIKKVLPEGFQRAEFLLAHGFLDAVVPRGEMREWLHRCLDYVAPGSNGRGWAVDRLRARASDAIAASPLRAGNGHGAAARPAADPAPGAAATAEPPANGDVPAPAPARRKSARRSATKPAAKASGRAAAGKRAPKAAAKRARKRPKS